MWPEKLSQGSLYAQYNQESRYATPLDEEVVGKRREETLHHHHTLESLKAVLAGVVVEVYYAPC